MEANDILPNASLNARLRSFDLLPPEIWSIVFSYITKFQDIYSISKTCKLFNEIVCKSIKSIKSNLPLSMRYIKRLPSLTRILTTIRENEIDLQYFTERQFKEIHIQTYNIIHLKGSITEYLLEFLNDNPQIDNLSIIFEVFIELKLRHGQLQVLYFSPSIVELLNKLTSPHIKIITSFHYDLSINHLDFSKYKILISSYNCNEEWFEIVKVPMCFKISCNISRFRNPHLLPHRIFNHYHQGNTEDFENQLDNLRYNFPNSNVDNVVYCRSTYLKVCAKKFNNKNEHFLFYSPEEIQQKKLANIRDKEKYEQELKRDISEKKYKII